MQWINLYFKYIWRKIMSCMFCLLLKYLLHNLISYYLMWSFSKVMGIVSGEFSWSTSISCSWSIHVNLDIRWFNIHGNITPLFDIKWFHLKSSSCIHSLFHLTFSLFWPININILKINCIACIIVFTIDISCCLGVSS